jgi:hypothetical protein
MYLLAAARVLARHWPLCLVGLVATVLACTVVNDRVEIDHEATSQMMVILPPDATGSETPTNPYLNLPEGLITTAGLIASDLSTKDAQRAFADDGYTADYTIAVLQGAGPLLEITAKASDARVAVATRDAVMARVDEELAERQESAAVPADQVMHTVRSSVSKKAEPLSGRRTKAVAAAAFVGLALAVLLTLLTDRALRRLAARRARAKALAGSVPADVAADVPEPVTGDVPPAAEDEPAPAVVDAPEVAEVPPAPEVVEVPAAAARTRSAAPRTRSGTAKKRGGPRPAVAIADAAAEGVESALEDRRSKAG